MRSEYYTEILDEDARFALDDTAITAEEFAGFSYFLSGREHVEVEIEYEVNGENRRATFWDPPESADMDLLDMLIDGEVASEDVESVAYKILGGSDVVEGRIWDELG